MGKKGSLARRLLALQLLIVLLLLAAVAAVGVAQASKTFRATETRRVLGIAEDVAANVSLRNLLGDHTNVRLAPFAESARAFSGADFVAITDAGLTVLASQDPDQIGGSLPIGGSTVAGGRAWVGVLDDAVVAHVPVIDSDQRFVGVVAVGRELPNVWQIAVDSVLDLLVVLSIASALGVAGSLFLAWWVKQQTFGLEPSEIAGLVEHREAMLHGIREGVVGLDHQHRITLVNDQAKHLLALPEDVVGRGVGELGLNDRLVDVLTGNATGTDQIGLRRGKVLIMNRMPIRHGDRELGTVVTLRDRTDLVKLEDQLTANRNTTDTLRAQAHEFSNRLHTIAGLIELGEYDEVRRYVDRVSAHRDQWHAEVTGKIADTAVAALLMAKASVASEQGAGLRLSARSVLREIDSALSADVQTVLGNLIDNAIDALKAQAPHGGGWIEVDLQHTRADVWVTVTDSGPGVAPEIAEEVFRHGFTTKAAEEGGERGLGLALTRQACVRRGGSVAVRNADGAVFTAVLPIAGEVRM